MAESNTNLQVAELDFDEIKANFTTYLGNQTQFQDYNFEGSGMSILLDQLSYTTHYMGIYANLLGNEMFGDTAQLRPSIISHAKHLGYTPGSVFGATALVDILVTPNAISEDTTANNITLSKYTKLISTSKDGTNHQFITVNANTATKNAGSFMFSNVWIKQGEVTTRTYLMTTNNPKAKFVLPSANIDTSTILVSVQASQANTSKTRYTLETDITEVRANSEVFWLEENSDLENQYSIYFGDNYIGKKPANGAIVIATYLEASGEAGNELDTFTFTDPVAGEYSANVIVTTVSRSSGGSSKETIEQIRHRAPKAYTSQNRAVTEDDYELLILRDYPNIESVSVWSGASNDPPVYGKVFISLNPKDYYGISDSEKLRIINEIISKRSVMTVIPEIVDPDYTYLMIRAHVDYDTSKTILSEGELETLIRQKIIDYRDTDLRSFKSVYRNSKLHRLIDSTENSILSNNIELYLQKRVDITLNETKNYGFNFDSVMRRSSFPYQAYSYPAVRTYDTDGITSRDTYFEVTPDSFTGIDSIDIITPGQGYTATPTVTITGDGTGATAIASIVNGKLNSVTLTNRGINYYRSTVSITGGNGTGATAQAVLGLSTGVIRSFYYNSNGEKVVIDSEAGSINFNTGEVNLTDLLVLSVVENDSYPENVLTFNAPPDDENIYPIRNRIVDIDANDPNSILVEMIPET